MPPPASADAKTVYGFPAAACQRIRSTVERVEGYYRNPPPRRGRYPVAIGEASLVPIQFPSGGIAAGSIATPTSATVTVLVAGTSAAGFTTTGATTATCYNTFATGFTGAKFGWGKYVNGFLYLVVADC